MPLDSRATYTNPAIMRNLKLLYNAFNSGNTNTVVTKCINNVIIKS